MWIVSRFRVHNVRKELRLLNVEPWGEQYELAPGTSLELVFYSQMDGAPEVLDSGEGLTVYGWQGSDVFVLKKNVPLGLPTLQQLIREEARSTVDESLVEAAVLEAEGRLEWFNSELETFPAWDERGRRVAIEVAASVTDVLQGAEADDRLVWRICQGILRSRGLFLQPDAELQDRFLNPKSENKVEERETILAQWDTPPRQFVVGR